MRLIDADEFKKQIAGMAIVNSYPADKANKMCELIDQQPTAYDVDKVLSELQKIAQDTDNYLKIGVTLSESIFYDGKVSGIDTAIAIVKFGGIK